MEEKRGPGRPPKQEADATRMFPVRLRRHYVPRGDYRIVGYDKPEVRRKNAGGQWVVEVEAEFVPGEMQPAPFPGAGFANKIWAGTVVELPIDEAKNLCDNIRAERADAIPD